MKAGIIITFIGLMAFYPLFGQKDRDSVKNSGMGRMQPGNTQKMDKSQKPDSGIMKMDKHMMGVPKSDTSEMRMQKPDPGKSKMGREKSGMGQMGRQDSGMSESSGMGTSPVMIAKPVFETTNAGLQMKVWISPMKEKWDDVMNQDVATTEELPNCTHHIMVSLREAESNKVVSGANVKVLISSPSNEKTTADLKTMMNQYGGNLNLPEKGEYQISVSVENNGVPSVTPFNYTVR